MADLGKGKGADTPLYKQSEGKKNNDWKGGQKKKLKFNSIGAYRYAYTRQNITW